MLIVVGSGAGCGNEPSGVLTTLEVTPAATSLFTVAPGNTVVLSVVAKDQDGQTMAGVGSPTFSSDNGAAATVSGDGTITAAGAGTAQITASLTADGVTRTGTTTVTVQVAPASAGVQAPQLDYEPEIVDVSAGGLVTWTFGAIHHNVDFTTAGAPADLPEFEDGSASRTFPVTGSFNYRCSIHPSMTGVVHVH